MNEFFIIRNPEKNGADKVAESIKTYLHAHGANCVLGPWYKGGQSGAFRYTDKADVPKTTQCVITLGGDGTLIQAARDLIDLKLSFIGVNLGSLGYLTQISGKDDLEPVLDALLSDDFHLEKRMMIAGTVFHEDKPILKNRALNDIVITRKDTLRVLKFEVYLNGVYFNQYTADGLILSTPTGSTAYNLSAGGPIAVPGAQLLIMTPICSHTLNARSVVLSPEDRIAIRMVGGEQKYTVVFDGDVVADFTYGDTVEICRAKASTELIRVKEFSFLDNLRYKMARI